MQIRQLKELFVYLLLIHHSNKCVNGQHTNTNGNHQAKHQFVNHEYKLMDKIFRTYNNRMKPPGIVQVKFSLMINQIIDIIEKDQIMVINAFLDHKWVDQRLAWDPKEYGNVTILRISGDKLWTPDTFIYTPADKDGFLLPHFGVNFVVNHKGEIFWPNPQTQLRVRCRMGILWFPFDEQICVIVFGSWSYSQFNVNYSLVSETLNMDTYTENNVWKLLGCKAFRSEVKYDSWIENDAFAEISYKILIKRKSLFVLQNFVIPAFILCILILVSFFIPFASEMQIGISIVLSFSVFKLRLSDDVPVQSDSIPLINVYFTLCMAFAMSAMVWFSLRNMLAEARQVPRWIRYVTLNYIWYILFLNFWKEFRASGGQRPSFDIDCDDAEFEEKQTRKPLKNKNISYHLIPKETIDNELSANNDFKIYTQNIYSKSISQKSNNSSHAIFSSPLIKQGKPNDLDNGRNLSIFFYDPDGKKKLLISLDNDGKNKEKDLRLNNSFNNTNKAHLKVNDKLKLQKTQVLHHQMSNETTCLFNESINSENGKLFLNGHVKENNSRKLRNNISSSTTSTVASTTMNNDSHHFKSMKQNELTETTCVLNANSYSTTSTKRQQHSPILFDKNALHDCEIIKILNLFMFVVYLLFVIGLNVVSLLILPYFVKDSLKLN